MFHLVIIALIGACAALDGVEEYRRVQNGLLAPPYVQSRASFSRARFFLQERLPHEERNITNAEAKTHFSHGVVAGVVSALVNAYENKLKKPYRPLVVLYKTVPDVWKGYNELVADPANELLLEAQHKVQPISLLIDSLCSNVESLDECNREVDRKVSGNVYLQSRAKLLLQLGDASDLYLDRVPTLDRLAASRREIPYLIDHVDATETDDVVKVLLDTFLLLRKTNNLV